MLERLAEKGFLVVATPYQLSFDHLETCDEVITKFEAMAPTIARQYGALPVVGIGHSCGALLQLLITCLFPDTPRAANALISFNNKPVTDAIPFFEEVFAPLFTTIATKNGTFPSSNEAISLSLQLAKAATEGTAHNWQKKCRISNMPWAGLYQAFVTCRIEILTTFFMFDHQESCPLMNYFRKLLGWPRHLVFHHPRLVSSYQTSFAILFLRLSHLP
jgi:hypothetical protein